MITMMGTFQGFSESGICECWNFATIFERNFPARAWNFIGLVDRRSDMRHFPEISRREDLNMLIYQAQESVNRGFQTVVRGS